MLHSAPGPTRSAPAPVPPGLDPSRRQAEAGARSHGSQGRISASGHGPDAGAASCCVGEDGHGSTQRVLPTEEPVLVLDERPASDAVSLSLANHREGQGGITKSPNMAAFTAGYAGLSEEKILNIVWVGILSLEVLMILGVAVKGIVRRWSPKPAPIAR
ncbi:Uncharacterized protein TPAR_05942 [Tolypocladium paradoxum]|uniref:Uncharacterized protein n=1 Tax=Tolypocladium paradoxum TaxID=94208 RepID=A0A2S4KUK0_9HYPO|nr:Uncharacterized protein TPAR_05942 [Tolypocladium paradoxum]